MGAAAFLMAESTGFTYAQVVKSAIIPAVLYFSGILISVHHEARKIGLKGMEDKDIPKIGVVMRERGHLLMPLIFMIYMLSAKVTPPMRRWVRYSLLSWHAAYSGCALYPLR